MTDYGDCFQPPPPLWTPWDIAGILGFLIALAYLIATLMVQ